MDLLKSGYEVVNSAWVCLKEIKDRIEKIEISNTKVENILKQAEFIESQLKKVEDHIDDKTDLQQLQQFNSHLVKAKDACQSICPKSYAVKFVKAPGILVKLGKIEEELEKATQPLTVFIGTLHLVKSEKNFAGLSNDMAKLKTVTENPDSGLYFALDKLKKPPFPPILSVKVTANRFVLSWEPADKTVTKYELCYNDELQEIKVLDGGISEVAIGEPWVEPGKIYTIKIRGVNLGGKGAWSNSVVAQFDKPLPRQPSVPQVKFLFPTLASITVTSPEKVCSTESPVTQWLIEYVEDGHGSEWHKVYRDSEPGKKYITFPVSELKPDQRYHFRVSAKNTEGWSKPSPMVSTSTNHVTPQMPTNFRISSKRTHSLIKLRWKPPEDNQAYVTHYEVRKKAKKEVNYDDALNAGNKLSFTFKNLHHNRHYVFQVRACNNELRSGWCDEIEANTRMHKAIKAVLTPAVYLGATAGAPLLTTMGLGMAAGESAKDKGKGAAVVAGTAGTIGGAAIGTLGAPLIGAGLTYMFYNGMDTLSDQSDDDD